MWNHFKTGTENGHFLMIRLSLCLPSSWCCPAPPCWGYRRRKQWGSGQQASKSKYTAWKLPHSFALPQTHSSCRGSLRWGTTCWVYQTDDDVLKEMTERNSLTWHSRTGRSSNMSHFAPSCYTSPLDSNMAPEEANTCSISSWTQVQHNCCCDRKKQFLTINEKMSLFSTEIF